MPQQHESRYRVSYGDTDRMARVYYANYLEICERARTEMLRDIGFPYRRLEAEGLMFPVRQCQVRYYGYAEYDDMLVCRSHVARMRHATLALTTDICRESEDRLLVSATVELASVGPNGKPTVMPEALREALVPYLDTEEKRK